MNRLCFLFLFFLFSTACQAQETEIRYLSGTDKDHTVDWDFMVSHGMRKGTWARIPVPSCWEQQGFGTFNYFEDKVNGEEEGLYRHLFQVEERWKGKKVFLVFEGVMTDAQVKVNGREAGPVHQGGFCAFRYEVTSLLQQGTNLLEVAVRKKSANASINRAERQADFWLFGGIYRPVSLQVVPETFIERVALDAKGDGSFSIQVLTRNTRREQQVDVQILDLAGKPAGAAFRAIASDSVVLQSVLKGIRSWNPEEPNLYQARISIREGGRTIHTVRQRFGFRTVEVRKNDGLYLNGTKVILKGVNRHSQWPESGRTLSRPVHLLDIGLMKAMNMNAVRMSHYPPDADFLDLCDSLGLMVIDELTGWQKAYDTVSAKRLVKELIVRDVNHPSIILWANGNEGGWNRSVDGDYSLYDPQKRHVIHPWERFNGTETKHYPDFAYVANSVLYGDELFFPTEFMHGLFDGGHGAALEDFWNEMNKHRAFTGGFLWSFHDEGVVRTDRKDTIDVAGNSGPDGILGPYREKEGSFYTIKELWSPVFIERRSLPVTFNGRIEVENRYLFTNLSRCRFAWALVSFPAPGVVPAREHIEAKGTFEGPNLQPGGRGYLELRLPPKRAGDVLRLVAYGKEGDTVCQWSWALRSPGEVAQARINATTSGPLQVEAGKELALTADGITYRFDTSTGFLKSVTNARREISLSGGPAPAGIELSLASFKHYKLGESYVVEPVYAGNKFSAKWIFTPGSLPKLEYSYPYGAAADFRGITFNYPEEKIKGMQWMGRGPYRVWKNRLKGQQLGVWEKAYNNTVTGENWSYPEFKGWHADLYWVRLQNKEQDFTVYADGANLFLQMLQPQRPKAAGNENTSPSFPKGSIGFMSAISAIGTKFQPAEVMGPQSGKNVPLNYTPFRGALYFDFSSR